MIFIAGIVGSLFVGCLFGVVVLEKTWVRVAMLLLFGIIAFLILSAYHHAELGKQRARFMHEQNLKDQTQESTQENRQQRPEPY